MPHDEAIDLGHRLRNTLRVSSESDFIESIGLPLLAHRLRRLSDAIVGDVGVLLSNKGLNVPPRAASLMLLLADFGEIAITAAAKRLKLSHPMIINLAKSLEEAELVETLPDAVDKRRRMLRLTSFGRVQVQFLLRLNDTLTQVFSVINAEAGVDLYDALTRFESASQRTSVLARATALLEQPETGTVDK